MRTCYVSSKILHN